MCVVNAGSSPVEVSVKQSAVTPGLLLYFKNVKMKMILKTRIVNTAKDGLFVRIFNSQLHGLGHYTQVGEKKMSLKEIQRRIMLGRWLFPRSSCLTQQRRLLSSTSKQRCSAVFNSTTMKNTTTLDEEKTDTKNSLLVF